MKSAALPRWNSSQSPTEQVYATAEFHAASIAAENCSRDAADAMLADAGIGFDGSAPVLPVDGFARRVAALSATRRPAPQRQSALTPPRRDRNAGHARRRRRRRHGSGRQKNLVPRTPIMPKAVLTATSTFGSPSGRSKTIWPMPSSSVPPWPAMKLSTSSSVSAPKRTRVSAPSCKVAKLSALGAHMIVVEDLRTDSQSLFLFRLLDDERRRGFPLPCRSPVLAMVVAHAAAMRRVNNRPPTTTRRARPASAAPAARSITSFSLFDAFERASGFPKGYPRYRGGNKPDRAMARCLAIILHFARASAIRLLPPEQRSAEPTGLSSRQETGRASWKIAAQNRHSHLQRDCFSPSSACWRLRRSRFLPPVPRRAFGRRHLRPRGGQHLRPAAQPWPSRPSRPRT